MSNLYELEFSPENLPYEENAAIYQSDIKSTDTPSQIYVFNTINVNKYELNSNLKSWQNKWIKSLETHNSTNHRVLYFPKINHNNKNNIVMLKTSFGINFYQFKNDNFDLITRSESYDENTFHDAFLWNESKNVIKTGHFYRNDTLIGVLTKHQDYGVQFYVINQDTLYSNNYPIWPVTVDSNPIGNDTESDFFLADIKSKGQDNIIVRNRKGLNIYEFDENYDIKNIMEVGNGAKFDDTEQTLFFPNLTGKSLRDIVAFNKTGMFIFQYDHQLGTYDILHYDPLFSEIKGWTKEHVKSITFEDLNADGIHEMIFTGPQGIDILSFDKDINEWTHTLNTFQIPVSKRHGKIMTVMSPNRTQINNPMIFTHHGWQVNWANIMSSEDWSEEYQTSIIEKSSPRNVSDISSERSLLPPIPRIFQGQVVQEKRVRLLRDQLDISSMMNVVDKYTGKTVLRLPLVDLFGTSSDDIKVNFIYNSIGQESGIMGVGWSLPRNFIAMNHQSSVFKESEIYYLIVEDMPTQLIFNSDTSTDDIYSFKLPHNTEIQIRYYKTEEKWEIKGPGTTQIYGSIGHSSGDPIIWEIHWENWKGFGSSPKGQTKIATSWYLVEVRDDDNVIKFTYDVSDYTIPGGNSFTREIYLKTITSLENQVTFKYSAKHINEYEAPTVVDQDGLIRQQMVISRYLEGYSVSTPNYHQNIDFVYKITNSKRFLSEIKQENDPVGKPVLQFGYKDILQTYFLDKVTLPSNTRIEFQYDTIGDVSSISRQLGDVRTDVAPDYKVTFLKDDVLVSSTDAGKITLKTFRQDTTSERTISTIYPILGSSLMNNYEIIPSEDFFAIIIYYPTKIELFLFRKETGTWTLTSEFVFDEESVIRFGRNFIITVEKNSPIQTITWNRDSGKWQKELFKADFSISSKNTIPLVVTYENTFLVYDDSIFWIAFKDREQKWHSKKIKEMPRALECMKTALNKFKLDEKISNPLLNFFKIQALQLQGNIFALSRWYIKGSQVHSLVDLFTLNNKYEIAKEQQFDITQKDLLSVEIEHNGLKIGYKISGDEFKITVNRFLDSAINDMQKQFREEYPLATNDEKESAIEMAKIQTIQSIEELSNSTFLLNPLEFVTSLSLPTTFCGNHTFAFTGVEWKKDKVSMKTKLDEKNSIVLGKELILCKQHKNSSIKLHEGTDETKLGKNLVDLEVTNFQEVYNAYPVYLAYQGKSTPQMIEFTNDGKFEKIVSLPRHEKLTSWSNYQMLVSSIENYQADQKSYTLVFRQTLGLNRLLPNPVITKMSLHFEENGIRTTAYEYKEPKVINNAIYYDEVSIIPGNDRTSFGWIQENRLQAQRKIFNDQNNLVNTQSLEFKNPKKPNNTSTDQTNLFSNGTIFDASGKFKVAEFFTSSISDEEASYYGFEDYEINRIGARNQARKWVFNEKNIVKNEFSYTGQNHLKLTDSILYGIFQPKRQYQNYIASCWVRPHNETLNEDAIATFLTANIQVESNGEIYECTRIGEVKYKLDNWYYLEVLVDFLAAKETPNYYTNSVQTAEMGKPLKTFIVVRPSEDSTIDIDHIRFSPLNSLFQGTVYDAKNMVIKEEIRHDGLIKRYIYDHHNNEIGTIDGYGHLKEFSIYTKASSVDRITKLNSVIQVHPDGSYYENFSPYSFKNAWRIEKTEAWQISPKQLQHTTSNQNNLYLNTLAMDPKSYGVRMCLTLDTQYSFLKFGNHVTFQSSGTDAEFIFLDARSKMSLNSEILIIVENTRLFVWVDGGLYYDGPSNNSSISTMSAYGNVKLSDVIVFNKPSIQTTYYNSLQEKVQEIKLESDSYVIVTEYLYDELGRQAITTQPVRLSRSNIQPLLSYYSDFVTNRNPYSEDSVWKSGQLKGKAKEMIGEYGFSQIKYFNNPTSEKSIVGLPGKEFSIYGLYANRFSSSCDNLYINNFYPTSKNYTYEVEYKSNKIKHITVLDSMKNRVVHYEEIPGREDVLSTYEYDENGRLIKVLPPSYHEKVETLSQIISPNQKISPDNNSLQKTMGTFMTYDTNDKIVAKQTPDSQKVEHIYEEDLLKFTLFHNRDDQLENIVYFIYDEFDRLSETGQLTKKYSIEDLIHSKIPTNNTRPYQQFHYSDFEREPLLRKKTKRTITYNEGDPLIEESVFNLDEETLSKRIIFPSQEDGIPQMTSTDKQYVAGKMVGMKYPVDYRGESMNLVYKYNKLGQIVEIEVGDGNVLASFTYNAAGQVNSEQYLPGSIERSYTRRFGYNSVGFLTHIKDKFLTEEISYTDKSYGGLGYGDGTVTSTKFEATWHEYCDNENLNLDEKSFIGPGITPGESQLCFQKLKEAGYLDTENRQVKQFYPELAPDFPMVCTLGAGSRRIQNILGMNGFPSSYGHSYDYGNQQQLTKAKYFVGKEIPTPLQPETFSKEIPGLNSTLSRDIWQILHNAGYIIKNNEKVNLSFAHGKRGKSFIRSFFHDLERVNTTYRKFERSLQRMLASCIAQNQDISSMEYNLRTAISKWNIGMDEAEVKKLTHDIMGMLGTNGYLKNPFTEEFAKILKKYQSYISDITRVLHEHFAKQLGEGEFDVESYEIDANGNHKLFYTGFDHYELDYTENTNQMNNIKYQSFSSIDSSKNVSIKYDIRGNVIQAPHKGIQNIEYNVVSNRPVKIQLVDGRSIIFHYDVQGERILKKVISKNGDVITKTHYIRDESGRTLVEEKWTYTSPDLPPDVLITSYIYGPRGLLGFIRRDEFFSVFSDHEGSVRLVIRGDEVVAAYDYLPYGNLMRKFGNNPESHISYLYTGQEFDEETGLYNFHARFYDPSIGRFYQMDPREQYFSPYKYAGNSPISMIDPSGEIAFLILIPLMIGFGSIGAYLGGAAANNQLNIFKWKWDTRTWVGVIGGGIGGALLPGGFVGSVAAFSALGASSSVTYSLTIGLGLAGAYVNIATANGNKWNPAKWTLNAATLNAAFQGFGVGSGLAGGVHSAGIFYSKLSSYAAKGVFLAGTAATGGGVFYLNGHHANWDFSSPAMYAGMLDAFAVAPDLPMFMKEAPKFFLSHGKIIKNAWKTRNTYNKFVKGNKMETVFSIMKNMIQNGESGKKLMTKQIWQNTARVHPITTSALAMTAGATAMLGSASLMYKAAVENGEDLSSPHLYYAMINGMILGGRLSFSHASHNFRDTSHGVEYIPLLDRRSNAGSYGGNSPKPKPQKPHETAHSNDPTDIGSSSAGGGKNKSGFRKRIKTKANPSTSNEKIPLLSEDLDVIKSQSSHAIDNKEIPQAGKQVPQESKNIPNKTPDETSLVSFNKQNNPNKSKNNIRQDVTGINPGSQKKNVNFFRGEKEPPLDEIQPPKQEPIVPESTKEQIPKETPKLTPVDADSSPKELSKYAENIARTSLEKLGEWLGAKKLNLEKYSFEVKNNLKDGLIPNKVVTVAVVGNDAVVAYSGTNSPGMVTLYYEGKYEHVFLPHNSEMAGEKIIIRHTPKEKKFLTKEGNDEMIDNIRQIWNKKKLKFGPNKYLVANIVKKFKESLDLKSGSEAIHDWKNRVEKLKEFDAEAVLESSIKEYVNRNSKMDGIADIKTNQGKMIQVLENSIMMKNVKEMVSAAKRVSFKNWSPENCAEPHALMALSKMNELFKVKTLTQGFSYMATFGVPEINYKQASLDWSNLKLYGKERCSQCKFTTREWLIVTDPEMDAMINKLGKMKAHESSPSEPSSSKNKRTGLNRPIGNRNRRSVPLEFIEPSYSFSFGDKIDAVDMKPILHSEKITPILYHENNSNSRKTNTGNSWMNDWFHWLKNTTSSYFNSSYTISNGNSSTSTTSQFQTQFDGNSVLLLIDLLVRKVTKEKFVSSNDHDESSPLEIQGQAISILTQFENILGEVAEESGISLENLNFDPIKAQNIIIKQIRNRKFSKISQILYSFAEQAYPNLERDPLILINLKHRLEESFGIKTKPATPSQQNFPQYRESFMIQNSGQNLLNVHDAITQNISNIILLD